MGLSKNRAPRIQRFIIFPINVLILDPFWTKAPRASIEPPCADFQATKPCTCAQSLHCPCAGTCFKHQLANGIVSHVHQPLSSTLDVECLREWGTAKYFCTLLMMSVRSFWMLPLFLPPGTFPAPRCPAWQPSKMKTPVIVATASLRSSCSQTAAGYRCWFTFSRPSHGGVPTFDPKPDQNRPKCHPTAPCKKALDLDPDSQTRISPESYCECFPGFETVKH